MKPPKIFPLLLILSLTTLVLSQEYLIVPNNHSSCHTNTTCFSLNKLAQTNLTNGTNLTLTFLPGEHTLPQLLNIQGFTHVDIIGQITPEIRLQSSIEISDIDQLNIQGLTFIGHIAGSFSISDAENLFISSCYFTGLNTLSVRNTNNIHFENVMFNDNVGTALKVTSTSIVSIENSTFTGNQRGTVYIISHSTGNISIGSSTFTGNQGGAVYISSHSTGNISIESSTFTGNQGGCGGAVCINSYTANISIESSTFTGNQGEYGAVCIINLKTVTISIQNSTFTRNRGVLDGAIYIDSYTGTISIENSTFTGNRGVLDGAVCIYSYTGTISIENSTFTGNQGERFGGAVHIVSGTATKSIQNSTFTGNQAMIGGAVYVSDSSTATTSLEKSTFCISHSNLTGNSATKSGSAIYVSPLLSLEIVDTMIVGNTGGTEFLYLKNIGNATFWGDNTISGNNGSMYVYSSEVFFNGPMIIEHGTSDSGAIYAIQSRIFFHSAPTIRYNTARGNGGGLFLQESSLFVNSPVIISHNIANEGGAIYAYQSTIEFCKNVTFIGNNSAKNGGGIYAISSIIKITKSFINIESNTAQANGGGLYLQQNSRLYILKEFTDEQQHLDSNLTISNNHAAWLGGGIYVDDSTASGGVCRSRANQTISTFLGECFIQTIALYDVSTFFTSNIINTFITNNKVDQSGSAIYGGLLDRCTVSSSSEETGVPNGLEYIKKTVELPVEDMYSRPISSEPLQVRLCGDSQDSTFCTYTKKGHSFLLHVRAIDQVGNPVNATIYSTVVTESGVGRLKEGQVEQQVGNKCTELEYNVFSNESSARLELHADGPCSDLGLSKLTVIITFLDCICPLGFHQSSQSNIECICECDEELQASRCFPQEETFLLDNTLWVGAANFSVCNETGYVVHDCPFDYCVDQPVNISLNSSQQIDRQCAYSRSGVLCGECKEGFSLVFATSKCKECSNTFLLLLIPFAVAGIVLIVFIMWLNITVANGTIYGLIVYANVLVANKAIFLPFPDPNFLTVFVSWVNLDLGIETCFYDGMKSQEKVLLQLAFPTYLFLLMFLIIILSKYVNSFAKLLSNRNPVAALCTLFILSYSKLLRLIIAALQSTSILCSDNSSTTVWLYDGNVPYFYPSHIPRFVAVTVILTACVLFTTLLFFGQWFPRCSKWKVMKWTKNTKYIGFMDAFHAPFTPKHRYWPGLLLFSLIAHNLAASMASNTSIPVLSAGCVAVGLFVFKSSMNRVYKNRLDNALENIFLLNIIVFTLGTYHSMIMQDTRSQLAVAYVSMSLGFILFVMINCYHFYKYVLKKSNVWNNQVRPLNPAGRIHFNFRRNQDYKRVDDIADIELPPIEDMYSYGRGPREETDQADKYITPPIIRPATRPDQLREPDLDILAPITTEDYRQVPPSTDTENRPKPVVTYSVVEIDKP